jgi:hypothetical protein
MNLRTFVALVALVGLCLAAPSALAGKMGAFEWEGGFELGFRSVDTNGNNDKYQEHVNLRTGPTLFNLDVTGNAPASDGFFDFINVSANTVGSDPFETIGVTLKKFHHYNFDYNYRKATYFYRDIIFPVELVENPALAEAGDFHTFNYDHVFHSADFDLRLTDQAKVFFSFDRQSKVGESTTSGDLARDEFELDQPLEQIKDDYKVGAELWFDKASIYGDFSYRDYENHNHLFLPGYSPGEDPEDATELLSFERMLPYEFTMPSFTLKGNFRPNERATINAGYSYSKIDADFDYEESALGTNYTGSPLDYMSFGTGDLDRTNHLFDVDGVVGVNDMISVIGEFRYHKTDQDGVLTVDGDQTDTHHEIETWGFDVGARVQASDAMSITGGLRLQSRDLMVAHAAGETDEAETTDHTGFFLNFAGQVNRMLNLMAEYEYGDYDEPITLMSPTTFNRFKVRARVRTDNGVSIVGSYLYRKVENDLSTGEASSHRLGIDGRYTAPMWKAWAGFGYTKLDNDITHELSTGTIWNSFYEAKTTNFAAGIEVDAHENLAFGFDTNIYGNSGSFELDRQQYNIYGLIKSPAGYHIRVGYERHDYNEDATNWDDYDANIFYMGVGYGFGRD